jgi:hypothetical protein
MNKEEVSEYASRYIDEDDMVDFPEEGDLFCFLHRELVEKKVLNDEEGWQFGGYGKLNQYELDMSANPVGKWIIMHYTSLAMFPPQQSELKLQPPHIVLGKFSSPEKTHETRILRIENPVEEDSPEADTNVMKFPGRK